MTIQIHTIAVGPIETNCFIIENTVSRQCLVVDPGVECAPVLAALRELTLTDILLTHAHFDHIGGVDRLVEASGARVWIHHSEASWLGDPRLNLSAGMTGICPPVSVSTAPALLQGGEVRELAGEVLHVHHTPGHTPGHVVYRLGDVVFVGDLVFRGSVGRTDFPGGDFQTLKKSIRQAILGLPDGTRLLPGHGPATTVGAERQGNPYLL